MERRPWGFDNLEKSYCGGISRCAHLRVNEPFLVATVLLSPVAPLGRSGSRASRRASKWSACLRAGAGSLLYVSCAASGGRGGSPEGGPMGQLGMNQACRARRGFQLGAPVPRKAEDLDPVGGHSGPNDPNYSSPIFQTFFPLAPKPYPCALHKKNVCGKIGCGKILCRICFLKYITLYSNEI